MSDKTNINYVCYSVFPSIQHVFKYELKQSALLPVDRMKDWSGILRIPHACSCCLSMFQSLFDGVQALLSLELVK